MILRYSSVTPREVAPHSYALTHTSSHNVPDLTMPTVHPLNLTRTLLLVRQGGAFQ